MPEFSLGPEFERFQRDLQEQMGDFTKVRESVRDAVGRGEAAGGRIVAEYAAEGGVTKLEIDPRALRLPAAELAEEIRAAVNGAAGDFQRKAREASTALFGLPDDPRDGLDPAKALASLDKIANGFAGQMRDLARELNVQQQRVADAMNDPRGPGAAGSPGPR
ncbi:YbaB/EbfC family nucleoid-associated protein [Actinomadura monticuli]|uniref:YbaB/EbfC family nucleoid-associated protein n=1 Tax=Actinomadura monticuli TaxID=3097367 RepID=A0ABV4Q3V0_9ACTN